MRNILVPTPIRFLHRVKDPAAWTTVGFSLHLAATTLWKKLSSAMKAIETGNQIDDETELLLCLRGPYALLAGLAIENFLKAAILQQTPSSRRTVIRSHDLIGLSRRGNFYWNDTDLALLRRLTTFIHWAGRYPVALSEDETRASRILVRGDYLTINAIVHELVRFHQKEPFQQ